MQPVLEFRPMQVDTFLSGEPWIEDVSQEFELLGAICNWEPEWRSNGAGGEDRYSYGGQPCYVPLLFCRGEGSDDIFAFSLNGKFVEVEVPSVIPCEWGRAGSRFRLNRDKRLVWDAKPSRPVQVGLDPRENEPTFEIWDNSRTHARLSVVWGNVHIKEKTEGEAGSWTGQAIVNSGSGLIRWHGTRINKAFDLFYLVHEGKCTSIAPRAVQKLYIDKLTAHMEAISQMVPGQIPGNLAWIDSWSIPIQARELISGEIITSNNNAIPLLRFVLSHEDTERIFAALEEIKAEVGDTRCNRADVTTARHALSYDQRIEYLDIFGCAIVREAYNAYLVGQPHAWMP